MNAPHMPHYIAVLARQAPTRRQIVRALYSGGLELRFIERASDLDGLFEVRAPELLILDADSAPPEEVELCLERVNRGGVPVVLLSLGSDKSSLMNLLRSYELSNLVAKHGAVRAVYPVLDERELLVTCQKVMRRDIFGVEKYIGAWGVKLHTHRVRSMVEKAQLLEEFEGYLTDLECPTAVVPDILTVADELVVNALVHAPREEDGTLRYEHLGPSPDLVVAPEDAVDVVWGCDGQRLMISVTDRFGALERDQITYYLGKGFAAKRHAVEDKPGGAGLGLAMSLKRLHQLVINIQPKARTEIMAGWYLRVDTASDFRQVSKSINVFWLPSDAPIQETLPHFTVAEVTGTRAGAVSLGVPAGTQAAARGPSASPRPAPAPAPNLASAPPTRSGTSAAPGAGAARNGASLPPPLRSHASPPPVAQAAAVTSFGPSGSSATSRALKRVTGRVNERFDPPLPEAEALRLDLRGVTGFSSAGVIRWLSWVDGLKNRDVELAACPEVVIRSACEVEGFLGDAKVRSVLAPYDCPSCLQAFQYELLLRDMDLDAQRACPGCGSALRFAGIPHEYRAFRDLLQDARRT